MNHKFRSNFVFQPIIRLLNGDVANGVILVMALLTDASLLMSLTNYQIEKASLKNRTQMKISNRRWRRR
jgi:hypothetical protein